MNATKFIVPKGMLKRRAPVVATERDIAAEDNLAAARNRVWNVWNKTGALLWSLKPVAMTGLDTLAVDAQHRMYYDVDCARRWTVKQLSTIVAHELQHPLREHPARAASMAVWLGARYEAVAHILHATKGITSFQNLQNWGGDLEINDDLDNDLWEWPPDLKPLLAENHGMTRGSSMEEYCAALVAQAEKAMSDPSNESDDEGNEGESSTEEGEGGESGGAPSEDEGMGNGERGDEDADDADGKRDGDGDDSEVGGEAQPQDGNGADDGSAGGAGRGGDAPDDGVVGDDAATGAGVCGSCAGNPFHGEGVGDLPDPTTEDEHDIIVRRVAQDIVDAGGPGQGSGHGDWWLKWAQTQFAPPKVNPMVVLAHAVRGAVATARARVDWKFGPPSSRREVYKRMGMGKRAPILPVLRGPTPQVLIIVDTSGSMGHGKGSRLESACRETFGFIRAGGGDAYGVACDTRVQDERRLRSVADVMELMKGGGGTDPRPAVRAARDRKPDVDVVVYITDGEVGSCWPAREDMPRCPFVTVVVNEHQHYFNAMPEHLKRHAVYIKD